MKASVRAKRISTRSNREDGDTTKARIVEAAGALFAENGMADVTSKEICEAAGINITAVNYHFGSRDGLQRAVLKEMYDFITGPDFLSELENSDEEPKEKLERFLNRLIDMMTKDDAWQIKLWAREMVSPSPATLEALEKRSILTLKVVPKLLSAITGRALEDPMLEVYFLFVMSPYMKMLLMKNCPHSPHYNVLSIGYEKVGKELNKLVFSGLDSVMTANTHGDPLISPN